MLKSLHFFVSILALLLSIQCVYAQIPDGYYDDASGLSGEDLKTALYGIIDNHTVVSYTELWTAFQTTDKKADGSVWDMYSNCSFTFVTNQCGSSILNECHCYNREHSFPKSWFNNATPMYSDLFHLYPTDGKVNGFRGNFPFGETSAPTTTTGNGSKLGPCSYNGYTGTVFEPIDEYKGDFARSYFYMATRYENLIAGWSSPMLDGSSFPAFTEWAEAMLLEWHESDPVSTKETERNDVVYGFQNNRNPFIDHPEYVNAIWGDGSLIADEPTNHAADFSAHCITLNWTDATGDILPDAYLIRMSSTSFEAISTPVDGTAIIDDASNKNINYGVQKAIFSGLTPNTIYYFKIFGYTGSGTSIDYKTDGSVMQVSIEAN